MDKPVWQMVALEAPPTLVILRWEIQIAVNIKSWWEYLTRQLQNLFSFLVKWFYSQQIKLRDISSSSENNCFCIEAATIAKELLNAGTSPTADAIAKKSVSNSSPSLPPHLPQLPTSGKKQNINREQSSLFPTVCRSRSVSEGAAGLSVSSPRLHSDLHWLSQEGRVFVPCVALHYTSTGQYGLKKLSNSIPSPIFIITT